MNKEMMIEEEKLVAYLNGTLTPHEVEQVEAWYGESQENQKMLEQVYYISFMSDRISSYKHADVERSLASLKRRIHDNERKKGFVYRLSKYYGRAIAASVIVGLLVLGGVMTVKVAQYVSKPFTVVTALGQRTQVVLPDGTMVWVNACSKLEYYSTLFSRERRVNMEGEAYFEVKTDKTAPFIVTSSGMQTRVLGTKFNIRTNLEEHLVIATLFSGSIKATAQKMKIAGIVMKPQQQLLYNTETGYTRLMESPSSDAVDWINGKLHFQHATMEEISRELERYYNVDIVFMDSGLQRERFTCDFDTVDNIYNILSTLQLTKTFSYKINKNRVELYVK